VKTADDILKRVPPQDLEAEQSVLGAVLLDNEAIEHVGNLLAEDFYRETHRQIFRAMIELADRKEPIDAITLLNVLRTRGVLEQIGGPGYVADLASVVPTAANVAHYAGIVRDKALLRSLGSVATDIASASYEAGYSAMAMIGEAERQLQPIFERAWGQQETHNQRQSVMEAASDLIHGQHGATVATGFAGLDRIAWLMPGDLITLAGDTSSGKSTLCANILVNVARAGMGAAMFSYEMATAQLNQRILCSMAQVAGDRGKWGQYSPAERERIEFCATELKELPLDILWARGFRQSQIRNALRKIRREMKSPLKLAVVDYLQLMQSDKQNRHRDQDYDDIVRALKDYAGEFGCAIILASQMNRESSKRGQTIPPRLMDLKGSSAIEQYSDGVFFLWVPDAKNESQVELLIAKNRNGTKGRVYLDHYTEFLRFEGR
jgi:replicative DNA helicase